MQNLTERFFDNQTGYLKAIDNYFQSSEQLRLATQVIPEGEMDKLVHWLDHEAHAEGAMVYLMELHANANKSHPVQKELRAFITLGVFDRKVDPASPYWCHVNNHYPINLDVSLVITDLDGSLVTHLPLTGFRSFDRCRIVGAVDGRMREHHNHHSIMTGIVDDKGNVIFDAYTNIRKDAMGAIRTLAERQIVNKDTDVAAVWLLAGLETGVMYKLEDHIDIMKTIERFHPRHVNDLNDGI